MLFNAYIDNESYRVMGGNHTYKTQDRPRRLTAAGVICTTTELTHSLSSHLETFDRDF